MNVQNIRAAIAQILRNHYTDLTVYDFPPPDLIAPAAAVDWPDEIEFDLANARGLDGISLSIQFAFETHDYQSGAEELSAYMAGSGPKSIKELMRANRTLNGTCSDSKVTSISDIGTGTRENAQFYTFRANLEIVGPGTS